MKKILLALTLITFGCTKQSSNPSTSNSSPTYQCNAGDPNIVGCGCMDGTTSTAKGHGACSGHGGVDYWICQ